MKNIIVIVLLVLLFVMSLWSTFFYVKHRRLYLNEKNKLETYNKTFSKDEIKNLAIDSNIFNVFIEENRNNEKVEILAKYNSYNKLKVNLKDNNLKIEQLLVNQNKNINFNGNNEYIKISLPKDTIDILKIESNVGNIDIRETLFDNLKLKSNVGNIKFTGKEFPNSTHIYTNVGNVKIKIPQSNDYTIKVHTSVGIIKVYDNFQVENFSETFEENVKNVLIESNVGSIKVSE